MPRLMLESDTAILLSLPVTPVQMNQALLGCKKSGEACIIDAGDQTPQRWVDAASAHGLTITSILQTHGHVDHVAGLAQTKELLGAEVKIHACKEDWAIFKSAPMQGMMFGIDCPSPPPIDVEIGEGDEIKVGEHRVQVLHTPGHSPGHVCFYVESEKLMVSGDLIFEGSIGRTDLPLCDGQAMMASLERIKRDIPRDTTLFPGHMGVTTMGKEIDTNPFLR